MTSGAAVVVARYRELGVLRWCNALSDALGCRVVVYDKAPVGEGLSDLAATGHEPAPAPGVWVVRCDNVGREAETWLRHVAEHYDGLAPATLFLQGNPFDHAGLAAGDVPALVGRVAAALASCPLDGCEPFSGQPIAEPDHANGLPKGAIWREMMGGGVPPRRWRFMPGAQYAVGAGAIRARAQEFYAHWLRRARAVPASLTTEHQCWGYHPGWVDAWTLERLWLHIWDACAACC